MRGLVPPWWTSPPQTPSSQPDTVRGRRYSSRTRARSPSPRPLLTRGARRTRRPTAPAFRTRKSHESTRLAVFFSCATTTCAVHLQRAAASLLCIATLAISGSDRTARARVIQCHQDSSMHSLLAQSCAAPGLVTTSASAARSGVGAQSAVPAARACVVSALRSLSPAAPCRTDVLLKC